MTELVSEKVTSREAIASKNCQIGPKKAQIAPTAKNQKDRKQKFYKMKVVSEP